jgi:hypothetical protein
MYFLCKLLERFLTKNLANSSDVLSSRHCILSFSQCWATKRIILFLFKFCRNTYKRLLSAIFNLIIACIFYDFRGLSNWKTIMLNALSEPNINAFYDPKTVLKKKLLNKLSREPADDDIEHGDVLSLHRRRIRCSVSVVNFARCSHGYGFNRKK